MEIEMVPLRLDLAAVSDVVVSLLVGMPCRVQDLIFSCLALFTSVPQRTSPNELLHCEGYDEQPTALTASWRCCTAPLQ